jgi:hypothetical protein
MTDDQYAEIAECGRAAARAARAEHGDNAPSYPDLSAWLVLAADLRRRGETELLNAQGHQLFLTAYVEELKSGKVTPWPVTNEPPPARMRN